MVTVEMEVKAALEDILWEEMTKEITYLRSS